MTYLPESYNTYTLPDLRFSHHPATSPTVTPIILVILNRPNAKNAFTTAMTESLVTAFNLLSQDPRVRAVILTGSDPANKTFCVGMDLNESRAKDGSRDAHRDGGGRVSLSIYNCTKPVIAALNGSAVGVGITMTLAANIRVVSDQAKIGFVFARRGLIMEATSSFFLPRLIGGSRAMHLVTTGAVYPATHRLFDGLFSEVVPPKRVVSTALRIAEDVVANTSAISTKLMKDLIFRGPDSPEGAHLLESRLFYDIFQGRDCKEGLSSFLEKRDPKFEGSLDNDKDRPKDWPWWKDELDRSKL